MPKKMFLVLTLLFTLLGLVAASKPSVVAAESVIGCKQWHTVKSGEYLTAVARMYNTDWRTLWEINELNNPSLIIPGQKLCISTTQTSSAPVSSIANASSRVYAASVKEDQTVTLRGRNLTDNSRYVVYLRNDKSKLATDIQVGFITTDSKGEFKVTYDLPKKLYDVAKIKVTIINGKGDSATNWFFNFTSDTYTGGVGSPTLSFSVQEVREDKWVKIKTSNLPANVTFKVFIGKAGSKGEEGIQVGLLRSSKGGTVSASFDIPDELRDRSRLDLRLENNTFEMVSYLTLDNKNK